MKVIITEKINDAGIEILKKYGQVDCRFGISKEDLKKCLADYDVMIVRVAYPIDKEVIDCGKNLKAICMNGIGLNHIDCDYAKEKGIAVFNVADASNDAVAELAMALMLNIARKVTPAANSTRQEGTWNKHAFTGVQLKDKVLGILALGKIGSRVAKYAQAFGMTVIAFDPYLDKSKAAEMNVELVDTVEKLLARANIISVHSPLTKETYHMIGKDQIALMPKGSFILNLGRGGVVDEEALYGALKSGQLAGAAVDVMEQEPPGKNKLFELDNFMATPHIGAATIEAQEAISRKLAEKILAHLNIA